MNEIKKHPWVYILLFVILLSSLFFRVYRVTDLMGFYFDQGRDALVIWNLWHEWKPFLIGPVTGLHGIFLGPFFYYLIAPFYLIGGGNPAYPAVFLSFLSVIALFVTYILGWKMHSRVAGLIAASIGGFSYYIILAGRWLSNPTPILLTSVLLLLSLWKILESKSKRESGKWWLAVSLLVGISMHFESASAIFYIPMVFVFALWQWKKFPSGTYFGGAIFVFLLTLVPQLLFNFRHDNLLFNNFSKLFFEEKGFQLDFWEVVHIRLNYFWHVFSSKVFHGEVKYHYFFTLLSTCAILYNWSSLRSKKIIQLFTIFLGVPMLGYIFFQGNYGNIYDYYMTGYYLPMLLLFSLGIALLWNSHLGKVFVFIFLVMFFSSNIRVNKSFLSANINGPTDIKLTNEIAGVDWIYEDAKKHQQTFNTDVYVPPVIAYSYDYLFLWRGKMLCGNYLCGKIESPQVETLYILYETDPPHPERLEAFLNRYKVNTTIDEEQKFGGVTVQRRKRL